MPQSAHHGRPDWQRWYRSSLLGVFGAFLSFFLVLGIWLGFDLQRGHDSVLNETSQRATQQSRLLSQSLLTKILNTDYVLRDVLGRIQEKDLVYPDTDPAHAHRMTMLLKEKADTVPEFFSMVLYDRDCVFTATVNGQNTGVRSKQELCEARKLHRGDGPQTSYVPGAKSASGQPVIVLSRQLTAPAGGFLGGVLGAIEITRAQAWFDSLRLDPDDSVALLDASQVLLARRPLAAQAMGTTLTAIDVQAELRANGSDAGFGIHRDLDGRERIFGFSQVEGFPFTVAYALDKAKALAAWRQRAVELIAGYLALLVLAFLVARSHWTTLHQRETLRASEEHFRMLAENMADIVWRIDAQLRFTYVNSADQRLRGYARDEVIGTTLADNLTSQGRDMVEQAMHPDRGAALSPDPGGFPQKLELPMRHRSGGDVWIDMSSVPILGSDGSVHGYQGVGRDVTSRRQHEVDLRQSHQNLANQLHAAAEEKSALQEMATRDPLTGLYNRGFLDAALPRELARAEHDPKPLAVIMLDIDHFKKVNDDHGHAAGDDVLKALAALLKHGARESDLICRYGGEEFVAIMPNMSPKRALERTESWRRQLEEALIDCGASRIGVTMSAGIAVFPDHGTSPLLLLTRADEMLYRSKREGRNRISVYGAA